MEEAFINKMMTIIIPTYNRADSLTLVLEKLFIHTKTLNNIEIIVVDDGSIDDTKERIEEFVENHTIKIRYLFQQNSGPAAARNLGIKEAKGDILLFLDSDIIPSEHLISEHLKFHEKYPQYNFALRGSTKHCYGQLETVRICEFIDVKQINKKSKNAEYIELRWADFRSGNISLKRQFLFENGIFDEEMSTREDVELGYRLRKSQLKLYHSNRAMGLHLHPVDLERYFRYAEDYGKSLAVWYSKTPDLKKDLLKIGLGYSYGFLSWKKPFLMLKYFLRVSTVSKFTVKLIIYMGNIFKKRQKKLFHFCYRQAYQYYSRKAYKQHLTLIKKRAYTNK